MQGYIYTLFIIACSLNGVCSVKEHTKSIIVPTDGETIFLKPDRGPGMVETKWDLRTSKGSKMAVSCTFFTDDCLMASAKVYTGEEYIEICPERAEEGFFNVSHGNQMTLTIDNTGDTLNILCNVESTKAYLNLPEESVDSVEFGWGRAARKKPTCSCGWSNKNFNRIYGGNVAGINEYPFVVRLKYKSFGIGFCGGTIITAKHVLTAAHCVKNRVNQSISVLLGEHDLTTRDETSITQEIDVERIKIHPSYDDINVYNDIAILILKQDIQFNERIGPVCMPKMKTDLVGSNVKVMGWGHTKDKREGGTQSPVLRKATLKIIDPDICKIIFPINPEEQQQICVYTTQRDSCTGDSGGPIVMVNPETNMFVLVGTISYGRKCGSTNPSVNTDVAHYLDWIVQEIAGLSPSSELCY